MAETEGSGEDPLWFKDAIVYEVPVRAFLDTTGDGRGDFRGLTQKLDYIEDLGVTALWLLPFYPSPLRDDGYDISDYTNVHPHYGKLHDFDGFLRTAHRRGLRVITELVLNHTSDRHPWFQRARRARPGTVWRDFYVWSGTPDRYRDARVIFRDFESSNWTWDSVANAYYFHRFYSHQPDLNYANPRVRKEIHRVVDFWLRRGVDGLRLDAVPYLFEREGTNCENLPETHAFLREIRKVVDEKFPGRVLLAEANQWQEDAAEYFGKGDEAHMAFHFPLMPRLFMGLQMEDRFPIIEILNQTPVIPETCQWALFLRNHDELTLEMVTDEERDYIYRMYSRDPQARINLGIRRRLAPLLDNDRRKIELMLGLIFSLPGTPVLYYGDEVGMGDNYYLGDRNGVRTPMQWSADRNAGFSKANPQKLYLPIIIDPAYHYEAVNVETENGNPSSLLWWTRRIVERRKGHRAFGRGTIEFLYPDNRKVLAFVRRHEDESILVVANLSRHHQPAVLDLAAFSGASLLELRGGTRFPAIGTAPYLLALGAYGFYWFAVQRQVQAGGSGAPVRAEPPRLVTRGRWQSLVRGGTPAARDAVADYVLGAGWREDGARAIRSVEVEEAVAVPGLEDQAIVAFLRVDHEEGEPERYVLPLAFSTDPERLRRGEDTGVVARIAVGKGEGTLVDASQDSAFLQACLVAILARRRWKGTRRETSLVATSTFRSADGAAPEGLGALPSGRTHGESSVVYGDRFFLRLCRKMDPGPTPEFEMGWHLTQRAHFPHSPPVLAALQYHAGKDPPRDVAILTGYVRNEGDAWHYTLDVLDSYFERIMGHPPPPSASAGGRHMIDLAGVEPPQETREAIGPYLEQASLLGRRTAELHGALSKAQGDEAFTPEPYDPHHQKAIYHARLALSAQVFSQLRRGAPALPEDVRLLASRVLELHGTVGKRFRAVRDRRMEALRIRCHGDYQLDRILYTGNDFAIVDFRGQRDRPSSERRIKHSSLRDVAGMIRSFHRAILVSLDAHGQDSPEVRSRLEAWARSWYMWVTSRFLRAYLNSPATIGLIPAIREDVRALLDAQILEKAIHELGSDLDRRDGISVPLRGVLESLSSDS